MISIKDIVPVISYRNTEKQLRDNINTRIYLRVGIEISDYVHQKGVSNHIYECVSIEINNCGCERIWEQMYNQVKGHISNQK